MFLLSPNVLWCRECKLFLHRSSLIKNYVENLVQREKSKKNQRPSFVCKMQTSKQLNGNECRVETVRFCDFILWFCTWEFFRFFGHFSLTIICSHALLPFNVRLRAYMVTPIVQCPLIAYHFQPIHFSRLFYTLGNLFFFSLWLWPHRLLSTFKYFIYNVILFETFPTISLL